jgi:hypothetical protein
MKMLMSLLFAFILFSCNSDESNHSNTSENDTDAARNFIRAALDGKWEEARRFMIQDSTNLQLLDRAESMYQGKEREVKRSYRESNIRFYDTRKVNDTITVINYSNTYKNQKDSLKVVRTGGQWLIDLKYSLLPTDSVSNVQ